MFRKAIVVCFWLSISTLSKAQESLHISGTIKNVPIKAGNKLLLMRFVTNWYFNEGEFTIDENGSFFHAIRQPTKGMYRLRFSGEQNFVDFMITGPADTTFKLDCTYADMTIHKAHFTGSKDQAAFNEFSDIVYRFIPEISHIDSLTPQGENIEEGDLMVKKQIEFNKELDKFKANYSDSYAVKMLLPLYREAVNPALNGRQASGKWYQEHYFDGVDFEDGRIVDHVVMGEKLKRYYMRAFTPSEGTIYVDKVMNFSKLERVKALFYENLINIFRSASNDEAADYLVDTYDNPAYKEHYSSKLINLVEATKRTKMGNPVFADLALPDSTGKMVSFLDVCKANKATAILIWRSGCSHCEKFKPELYEYYKKFHAKGLEVYAISLDYNTAAWKAALRKFPTEWVNVKINDAWVKRINEELPYNGTPYLILANQSGQWVKRFMNRAKLNEYFEDLTR